MLRDTQYGGEGRNATERYAERTNKRDVRVKPEMLSEKPKYQMDTHAKFIRQSKN